MATASLLFAAGDRPCAADIRKLAESDGNFSISIDPSLDGNADEGWVEILANGLTFDLTGLAPFAGSEPPPVAYHYGLQSDFDQLDLEAITLVPGPHLLAGGTMFPVVRGLALLSAQLASLASVRGIAWHAARAASHPQYFQRGVMGWIEGGAFPGLGLTALATKQDGSMQSEGLMLFTGQELLIPASIADNEAEGAKVALRLLNWLVEHGRIEQSVTFTGPSGEPIQLEPVENSGILRVWGGTHQGT
ncbi:hypothetical protein [Aurantiacibacter sp. D1-12]|uniref:hypothetical protein n=1 Tax=Aurantiacibacter sp. D1-12 TaxID=2993658 RepID=UPI00237C8650|nr:hypothetical protein [Aurantiacibacter sp. D1-12]MDE1466839.1 hypothetical protein [Aurantiacibacter sp. D1-12]